jgi:hypothetical protein
VFNRYGTFDHIANKNLEDPNYAYLCYNLLNKATLTVITLIMKSPHIKKIQHLLQKNMYVKNGELGINQHQKRVLRKATCLLSL